MRLFQSAVMVSKPPPNNSFKPTPLRGVVVTSSHPSAPASATLPQRRGLIQALGGKKNIMGLPEKTTLTLTEVVARWKHWGCDYATLHSYAEQDLLVLSVYLRDIGSHKSVRTEADTEITREVQSLKFVSPGAVVHRLLHLSGDDSRRILEANDNEQIAVSVLYWTPVRIKKLSTYYPSAKYFTRQDLVVTRDECERFERRHSANGLPGLVKRSAFWIKEPSKHKALKLIGGALAMLAGGIWAVFTWHFK